MRTGPGLVVCPGALGVCGGVSAKVALATGALDLVAQAHTRGHEEGEIGWHRSSCHRRWSRWHLRVGHPSAGLEVNIDLFERLPRPMVRALRCRPDHPRIKQIIVALHKIPPARDIRLLGNVEVGQRRDHRRPCATTMTRSSLRRARTAITRSDIPGVGPASSPTVPPTRVLHGNLDYPRTWPLEGPARWRSWVSGNALTCRVRCRGHAQTGGAGQRG